MEDVTSIEQQRKARRQKLLARSQAGQRSSVIDFATQSEQIAPEGLVADIDQESSSSPLQEGPSFPPVDSTKSASRLAAERRRQRILSKSTERMAKVQGDRVIRGAGDENAGVGAGADAITDADADEGVQEGGGGDSLDDMLKAAEAEVFGVSEEGSTAEAKPAAPHQACFKPSTPSGKEGVAPAAVAQSKGTRERVTTTSAFKPARSEGGPRRKNPVSNKRPPSRRPTGNKALDKQPFDLAAIKFLSHAGGVGESQGATSAKPPSKILLGGVRFWVSFEGMTKTVLLVLVGIGLGGLLLPEGRAAVAQAKFESEYLRSSGGTDSRSRLESFLSGGSGGGGDALALDSDFGASSTVDEFGDSRPSMLKPRQHMLELDNEEVGRERRRRFGGVPSSEDDGLFSATAGWFLDSMDYLLGLTHNLSTKIVPWVGGDISFCVPAMFLVMLVRAAVATVFSVLRLTLGLPAFPPTICNSKPGMVMGMILAQVPTLGKILAFGTMVKELLSDTNLVVAGTVLTLALCLSAEEGSEPRRFLGSVFGVFRRLVFGVDESSGLKEL